MANFKKMTVGKTVVMGRATLESLPGSKPLPNRENIVLTRNLAYAVPGAFVCRSYQDLFAVLREKNTDDIFVIGGESVYRALLDYCKKAYITRIYADAPADCFMPDFDALPDWQLFEASEPRLEQGITYRFLTYAQEHPKLF